VAANSGGPQTLDFWMMRPEFYHCASAAGLVIVTKTVIVTNNVVKDHPTSPAIKLFTAIINSIS
jgi:hypothetical protein